MKAFKSSCVLSNVKWNSSPQSDNNHLLDVTFPTCITFILSKAPFTPRAKTK